MSSDQDRLSVSVNDEVAALLRRLKAERGWSATEATRQAFSLLEAALPAGQVLPVQDDHAAQQLADRAADQAVDTVSVPRAALKALAERAREESSTVDAEFGGPGEDVGTLRTNALIAALGVEGL